MAAAKSVRPRPLAPGRAWQTLGDELLQILHFVPPCDLLAMRRVDKSLLAAAEQPESEIITECVGGLSAELSEEALLVFRGHYSMHLPAHPDNR
jgi:hypothetical protein